MPPPNPPKPRCPGSDGADECPSPSPPFSSHGQGRLVTPLVIPASLLVFLSLVSLSIYCFVRRRRRRRQQSLLAAEAATANPGAEGGAAAPIVEAGGPEVDDGGEDDDEVVLHHAWHIRTVGLDEAAIESIALTRYRAGAGMLGAADCSVCLAEFRDGELLRLLPKCGHAFHVPCIRTWLRAHVNCPLCRADIVLDPAAAEDSDRFAAGASADTDAEQASSNTETLDREQPGPGQQQNEQHEVRVQIDQRDQSSSPEPQRRQPGSRVQNFRRVASMDSSIVSAAEAPEDEQRSKENQGNGDAACCKVSSGSGRLYHMKRSLSGGGRGSLSSRGIAARAARCFRRDCAEICTCCRKMDFCL